jgi:putative ABC transport system permease protein
MNIGPILRAMKHSRTRVVLLVLEIAMTLAIVTNCVNVILAERARMQRPSGFDDDNTLWVRTRLFAPEFREGNLDPRIDEDVRILSSIPGVKAAAASSFQLWEGGGSSTAVKEAGTKNPVQSSQIYWGTKDQMKALGIRITEGRDFADGDHGKGTEQDPIKVTVISRSVAEAAFPNSSAVGKTLVEANDLGEPYGEGYTVIGVFETFFNPFSQNPEQWTGVAERAIFLPARVGGYRYGLRYLIRTEPGTMKSVIAEVEKRLLASHPGRVVEFMPTPEKKAQWFAQSRLTVGVMTGVIFALVFVTALGILGITALSVSERTKQIGTRRALGATRFDILRHFLIENWLITTVGIMIGVVGAYALNFALVSKVTDAKMPWQLVASGMVLLWASGLAATLPPALRATNVPPSIATRSV